MKKEFMADFETCADVKKDGAERVWLWAIREVSTDENADVKIGYNIDSFLNTCGKLRYKDNIIYFHNLKFDAAFIINELINRGFEWVRKAPNKLEKNEFSTNMTFLNVLYSVDVNINGKRIHFKDSLKLFNSSVEQLAEDFDLPVRKGEIDYVKVRDYDYIPTDEEVEYIKNDVFIISYILYEFREQGYKKYTASSSALHEFLRICFPTPDGKENINYSTKCFKGKHPITEEEDRDCRESYHGGICYLNPKYKNKEIGVGRVYDANSMYSSAMYYELMPYGKPLHGKGKPFTNNYYNLFICKIKVDFKVKDGFIPIIPNIKKNISWLGVSDMIDDTEGNIIEIWINSVDLDILIKTHDIYYLEYVEYYSFKSKEGGFFRPYIDKFMKMKIDARAEGNKSKSIFAKLFLNGLYGKMGTRPFTPIMKPMINEKGLLQFRESDVTITEPVYVPLASFITAYARKRLLTAIYANIDRFVYCDTDSIHLIGDEPAKGINIDNYKLNTWKLEKKFSRARYLGRKMYMLEDYNTKELKICCSGLSRKAFESLNFDNFKYGTTVKNLKCIKTINGNKIDESDFVFKDKEKRRL